MDPVLEALAARDGRGLVRALRGLDEAERRRLAGVIAPPAGTSGVFELALLGTRRSDASAATAHGTSRSRRSSSTHAASTSARPCPRGPRDAARDAPGDAAAARRGVARLRTSADFHNQEW